MIHIPKLGPQAVYLIEQYVAFYNDIYTCCSSKVFKSSFKSSEFGNKKVAKPKKSEVWTTDRNSRISAILVLCPIDLIIPIHKCWTLSFRPFIYADSETDYDFDE